MIPKIIHFCWLSGDPFPNLINKCIESWKEQLSDYEFILWDTNRIDIDSNLWLKQAFENKKYAFAADYIRFYALYHFGGIYLDADVEVLRSFNDLLSRREFIGEEASGDIEAAVIGAEKNLSWIKECLEYYDNRPFIKSNGDFDMKPVPLMLKKVLNNRHDIEILPYYYFSPKNYNIQKIEITSETYCIHHFDGKWVTKGIKYKIKVLLHKLLYFFLGRNGHNKFVSIIRLLKKNI